MGPRRSWAALQWYQFYRANGCSRREAAKHAIKFTVVLVLAQLVKVLKEKRS